MLSTVALSLIGALCVVSACISGVSLWLTTQKPAGPNLHDMGRQMKALELSHADLADKVQHWMKRERVRNLREGRELDESSEMGGSSRGSAKDQLRARFGGTF
jgi:hypothetical protein